MSRLSPPRRVARIQLLIGLIMIAASAITLIAHFFFGVVIINKGTGSDASAVSIVVEGAFFFGLGAIFAFSGWNLLRAAARPNDR